MPRVSINLTDEEHTQYKVACIKNKETMTEAGRKMLVLYASGHLCTLVEAQEDDGYKADIAAVAIAEFLTGWGEEDAPS